MTPLTALALSAMLGGAIWATPAAATDAQPGDAPIPLEEWRALTTGRTVWYSLNGRHWGKEYFHPGRDSATFVTADGDCVTAPWIYADGLYCFAYAGMDCFRHVRRGETMLAIPYEPGGQEQVIERITDTPLSCEAPLSS
jgi:hypothetical protein